MIRTNNNMISKKDYTLSWEKYLNVFKTHCLWIIICLVSFPFVSAQDFSQIGETFKSLGIWTLLIILGIVVVVGIVGSILIWQYMKKKWYLNVEFKMIRADNKAIIGEWGKGYYETKKGILWVKRKKMRKEYVKAKDMGIYLQGSNTVTVIGNTGNWKLVIPDSYLEVIDDVTGEEASVMKIRTDMKEDKPWAVQTERMLEDAFSIATFWNVVKDYIGWGVVIFIVIVSEGILYYLLK